jgi:hypothetical protein
MRYENDTYPFDTDNRAWRRFLTVLGDHFEVFDWVKEDGRPIMVTLVDLASGDTFTTAVLDSLEMHEPHALLVVSADTALQAHGPFAGASAAAGHTAGLALGDLTVAATRPVALQHPDQRAVPDDAWLDLPAEFARHAHPAPDDARAAVLILLDRVAATFTVIGPFPTDAHADRWRPDPDLDPAIDRLVVPLHTAPPTPTAG